jgi:hypothetical protein
MKHLATPFEREHGQPQMIDVTVKIPLENDGQDADERSMANLIDKVNARLCSQFRPQFIQRFGTDLVWFHFVDRIVVNRVVGGQQQSSSYSKEAGGDTDALDVLATTPPLIMALSGGQYKMNVKSLTGTTFQLSVDNTDSVLELKKAICIMKGGQIPVDNIKLLKGVMELKDNTQMLKDAGFKVPQQQGAQPQLNLVLAAKTGGSMLEEHVGLLKMLSQAGSDKNILSLASHLAPALPLIAPCQLDSMFMDRIERHATSELARLARLLWDDAKAARLYGDVSETYIQLLHTRGDTIEERTANYIDDMLAFL